MVLYNYFYTKIIIINLTTIFQSATVLDLKKLISTKLPDVPFYRTKLMTGSGSNATSLDNDCKQLSWYSSVANGITMFVLVEKPFKVCCIWCNDDAMMMQ